MKNRIAIILVALGFLVFAVPFLPGQETEPDMLIQRASSAIFGPAATPETLLKALTGLLDAAIMILPLMDDSIEIKHRIDVAKKMMVERGMLNDKARQYLSFAYKLITGGKAWKAPEELTSLYREKEIMELSGKIGRKLIESALAERKAGRNKDSVRCLLEFVLLVVTPIEA